MTIPTDQLYKRKKAPEISAVSTRKAVNAQSSTTNNASEQTKKNQALATQKTVKEQSMKKNQKKRDLEQIARDNIEVQLNKEAVNKIKFNELFTDNLPPDAIELGQYVTNYKLEKENNGEVKKDYLAAARANLEAVRNISTHTQPFYLMVSDIITPPKGCQMVRP